MLETKHFRPEIWAASGWSVIFWQSPAHHYDGPDLSQISSIFFSIIVWILWLQASKGRLRLRSLECTMWIIHSLVSTALWHSLSGGVPYNLEENLLRHITSYTSIPLFFPRLNWDISPQAYLFAFENYLEVSTRNNTVSDPFSWFRWMKVKVTSLLLWPTQCLGICKIVNFFPSPNIRPLQNLPNQPNIIGTKSKRQEETFAAEMQWAGSKLVSFCSPGADCCRLFNWDTMESWTRQVWGL